MRYLIFILIILFSYNAVSQRLNMYYGLYIFETSYIQFHQDTYKDAYASSNLIIDYTTQFRVNENIISPFIMSGISYEFNRFLFGVGLGVHNVKYKVKLSGDESINYEAFGFYVPINISYSFWTVNDNRSFISAGISLKNNFTEKETFDEDIFNLEDSEYYEQLILSETYYDFMTSVVFRLGRESFIAGETFQYGIATEIPTQSNTFFYNMNFSLFIEYRFPLIKNIKKSNIYIQDL